MPYKDLARGLITKKTFFLNTLTEEDSLLVASPLLHSDRVKVEARFETFCSWCYMLYYRWIPNRVATWSREWDRIPYIVWGQVIHELIEGNEMPTLPSKSKNYQPSSLYSLSRDVPLNARVTTRAAEYCIDSSLLIM